jgi:hypothetical protein
MRQRRKVRAANRTIGALSVASGRSEPAASVAVVPSRGVAPAYRASACSRTSTFEVLCGASCDD